MTEYDWKPISTAPRAFRNGDAEADSFNNDVGGLGIAKDYDTGKPICLLWWVRHPHSIGWTPAMWASIPKRPSASKLKAAVSELTKRLGAKDKPND
jgi:hypothetical protein